jgi:diguanylate cyclase (GGDEF)-like protein/PAS domain S-box-containing protein
MDTPHYIPPSPDGEQTCAGAALHELGEKLVEDLGHELAALSYEAMAGPGECAHVESRLAQAVQAHDLLLDSIGEGIYVLDVSGRCGFMNKAAASLLGYTLEDVLGKDMHGLIHHSHADGRQYPVEACPIYRAFQTGQRCRRDVEMFWRRDGTSFPVTYSSYPICEAGRVTGAVVIFADVTERQQLETRLRRQALYDPLTNLPNRALLSDRLKHAMATRKRHSEHLFAVLFLDVDRFKYVNDSLGHAQGDRLLRSIGSRLEACIRPGDTIARFGGDEFAVLLEPILDIADAIGVAERIQEALMEPFHLEGHEVYATASIGIAVAAPEHRQPEDILRDADTAMYSAKAAGKERYAVFDTTMHSQAVELLQLEVDLRRAVDRREFRVFYQPIVSLVTMRVVGFEALIRWQHPKRGLVRPAEFIPLAEEMGLILPIGHWVLREACSQLRMWQRRYPMTPPLSVSVNLSAKQFWKPGLTDQIEEVLAQTGLPPDSLRLEITESALMSNAGSINGILERLRRLGVQLYIDDFGTGYSSLSYLHRFTIDALKIDSSFTSRMHRSYKDREIVHTIMTLAQSLGISTILEGVEKPEQLDLISNEQCQYGQGDFFSQPVDPAMAELLLVENRRRKENLAPPTDLPDRWSALLKADLVMRLLSGEPLDELCRESGISPDKLENWKVLFIQQGTLGMNKSFFRNKPGEDEPPTR